MEKLINKRIENYLISFKDDIRVKAVELGAGNPALSSELSKLVQFVYDYERLVLERNEFIKRKRVKNAVFLTERCCAKRANGEQCTRKRKDVVNGSYCGTHLKGTPHGVCETEMSGDTYIKLTHKVEIWTQDIAGIIYFIDKNGNVYHTEDIMHNTTNPRIIAKYVKGDNNTYSIPEYAI